MKNTQVGVGTKYIDISHHFMKYMVEDKDIDILYIRSEDNPVYIMTKNTPEEEFIGTLKESQKENSGISWILEGRMSRILESRMMSSPAIRLNIPVTHLLD